MEGWFAPGSDFTVLETRHDVIAFRHRLSWRFRMSRNHQPAEVVEQVAFIDVGPEGISQIDLLCSGFLQDAEPVSMCPVDAGPKQLLAG
jgi:hypothetical protein